MAVSLQESQKSALFMGKVYDVAGTQHCISGLYSLPVTTIECCFLGVFLNAAVTNIAVSVANSSLIISFALLFCYKSAKFKPDDPL